MADRKVADTGTSDSRLDRRQSLHCCRRR